MPISTHSVQSTHECATSHVAKIRGQNDHLLAAVLEEALQTLRRGYDPANAQARRAHAEARRWVVSGDRSSPFSFANICDRLGLDPPSVRASLLQQGRTPRPHKPRVRRRTACGASESRARQSVQA